MINILEITFKKTGNNKNLTNKGKNILEFFWRQMHPKIDLIKSIILKSIEFKDFKYFFLIKNLSSLIEF